MEESSEKSKTQGCEVFVQTFRYGQTNRIVVRGPPNGGSNLGLDFGELN